MRLSYREVKFLYHKKIKAGMKPQEAYDQIKEEFKFLNKLKGKQKDTEDKIDFDKEFAELRHGV